MFYQTINCELKRFSIRLLNLGAAKMVTTYSNLNGNDFFTMHLNNIYIDIIKSIILFLQ